MSRTGSIKPLNEYFTRPQSKELYQALSGILHKVPYLGVVGVHEDSQVPFIYLAVQLRQQFPHLYRGCNDLSYYGHPY